jgi:hypothetical protein
MKATQSKYEHFGNRLCWRHDSFLTNSKEQRTPWEANSRLTGQVVRTYREPDEFTPRFTLSSLKIHFNTVFSSTIRLAYLVHASD